MRRIVLVVAVAAAIVAMLAFAGPVFAAPDFSDCAGTNGCNALPADPKGPPETDIHSNLAPADKNAGEAKDVFTNEPSAGAGGDDVSPGGSSRFPAGNPEHAKLEGKNCWGDLASGNALFVTHNGFPSGERALDNEGRTKPEKLDAQAARQKTPCELGPFGPN